MNDVSNEYTDAFQNSDHGSCGRTHEQPTQITPKSAAEHGPSPAPDEMEHELVAEQEEAKRNKS